MTLCQKCEGPNDRLGQRYCRPCHANYMREWRKTHKLIGDSRLRNHARARARLYFKRGWINAGPCAVCGSPQSEMHHPDYSRPLHIYWLCRPHHLEWHAFERLNPAHSFDEWLPPGSTAATVGALSCEINATFSGAA